MTANLLSNFYHNHIGRLYARQIVCSSSTFSLALLLLVLLSSCFLWIFSLVTESKAESYDISQGTLSSEHKIMEAYGRIANNQIQNSSVSWIQSGLWYMTVSYNDMDNNKDAYFYTEFTMVKPDGSSMHKHFIKDFKSTTIRVDEEKITINGIADIYSGKSPDYEEVPIIANLKDNTVLGLTIDKDKTQQHFASSSAKEMFGILVDSRDRNKILSE